MDWLLTLLLVVLLIVILILLTIWYLLVRRLRGQVQNIDGLAAVVPAEAAREGAARGIQKYKLDQEPEWQSRLKQPVRPLEPLLVQRLDAPEPESMFYYLVPFGTSSDAVTAVAMVNGFSSEFEELTPMRLGPDGSWGQMASARRTAQSVRAAAGGNAMTGVHPHFVWRRCVESRSPYSPFRLIVDNGKVRYVRLDGKVFDRLTQLGPGGRVYDTDHPAKPKADYPDKSTAD